jgi:hypothetical protein
MPLLTDSVATTCLKVVLLLISARMTTYLRIYRTFVLKYNIYIKVRTK